MSEAELTHEQAVEAIYAHAAQQMNQGVSPEMIRRDLMEKGLDGESASTVVSNLQAARENANRSEGRKNMLYGALWCIGGIIVTVLTYSAASQSGGRYVITWGAIVFGGIQFFRGLMQSANE